MTESEEIIVGEIVAWLDSTPDAEDIEYYSHHITEEHRVLLEVACQQFAHRLYNKKLDYFKSTQCEPFLQLISELEQISYIEFLTLYNAPSVLASIQKKYTDFPPLVFPADIRNWAHDYVDKFHLLTLFSVAREYDQLALYTNSFLQSSLTEDVLNSLKEDLRIMFVEIGRRYESGVVITNGEIEEESKTLAKLLFFPPEFIANVLLPENKAQKYDLLTRLIKVITFLGSYGLEDARTDPERFLDGVHELVRQEYEDKLLVTFETFRRDYYQHDNTHLVMIHSLRLIFGQNNIMQRKVQSMFNAYYGGLSEPDRVLCINFLYQLLRQSAELSILTSPFTVDFFITRLKLIPDKGRFKEFVASMQDELDDDISFAVFEFLMDDLYFFTKTYPEPVKSATNV